MRFPLGKPILVMLILAAISGTALLAPSPQKHNDLVVWVFAEPHAEEYRSLRRSFQRQTKQSFSVDLITSSALNVRLMSLFMSPHTTAELPDAVEIEIGSLARYFRPPAAHIGFLPLNRYLENSGFRQISSLKAFGQQGWNARLTTDGRIYTYDGEHWVYNPGRTRPDAWIDRLSRTRLATWSTDGVIFGIPHDVHPVTITYRADLFQEAGIDLAGATTWTEFQQRCLAFQRYWNSRGVPYRHAMSLSRSNCEDLMQMLLQQHLNLIDADERVRINDPRVARTLSFYAQLAAGADAIGTPSPDQQWARDLVEGNICALFTPDWKVQLLKSEAPSCAGKLRMMPLPRFSETDSPTATWGGTMIAVPRECRRPDDAWKLIEYLYLSPAGLEARFAAASILPPLPQEWSKPIYHQSDPFFAGQDVGGLYAALAEQLPEFRVTAATPIALAELSFDLTRATAYVEAGGTGGLAEACQHWLEDAAVDLHRRIAQGRFDQDGSSAPYTSGGPSP